jgi:3-phosphoshikimate 1-carboxyvinyltransferase
VTDWLVPPASRPLSGTVCVPGDKSIGHRAVLFGALCDGPVEVSGLSGGEDNGRTMQALRELGAKIEDLGAGRARVHGVGLAGLRAPAGPIECGNSGTSMRLLAGLLAAQAFPSRLIGDPYLSKRPMRRVADPLRRMGASVEGQPGRKEGEIVPPLDVRGGSLQGIDYVMPMASAQVKSAVLIAGLWAGGETVVREPGPTRDHTERMLGALGAPLDRPAPGVARVRAATRLSATALVVPGDPSSAAFLIVAALLAGDGVRVEGVCLNPTRTGFLDALALMGAEILVENLRDEGGEPVGDLVVPEGRQRLRGARLAGDLVVRAIDEVPILSVAAAMAEGATEIADAEELRVKESDRVATTCAMLRAFGANVDERPDGLRVEGRGRLGGGGEVHAHGDHRIAMAAAVGALAAEGETVIADVDNVATSFPTFVRCVAALGGAINVRADSRAT